MYGVKARCNPVLLRSQFGGSTGIRTLNVLSRRRIKSPVLYQLSDRPITMFDSKQSRHSRYLLNGFVFSFSCVHGILLMNLVVKFIY